MNYIGSKKSLLNFLEESIYSIVDKSKFTFLDLFAGTGIVGQHFKSLGNKIIANDLQYYSYVLNKNYIENHLPNSFDNLINEIPNINSELFTTKEQIVCNYLDSIDGKEGFIFNNYCLGGTNGKEFERQYFSDTNGKKADAIRLKIENWKSNNKINDNEYYFLIATLLENLDKVANTASVYGAYLKHLKKSAQQEFKMSPAYYILNDEEHNVYNENIETVISKLEGDVLYLDPPYNHRQYSSNYHILETIAKYDNPKLKGKTGLRGNENQKSNFCSKTGAFKALSNVVKNANVKYIFLSYNNEGILSLDEIKKILSTRGEYGFFVKEYNRFKADTDENRNHTANSVQEYLHYVICDN
jgi:adenine-specific DNA-methyltransferase